MVRKLANPEIILLKDILRAGFSGQMERQPYRSIFKVLCEAGPVPRPGDLLHDNAVLRAANSRCLGLDEDLDTAAEIGSPPSAQTFPLVKTRTSLSANAATLF